LCRSLLLDMKLGEMKGVGFVSKRRYVTAVYLGGGVSFLGTPQCVQLKENVSLLDDFIIDTSYVQNMNMQQTVCEQSCKNL